MKKSGFTLIELLVVVAIIALLLSILIPSLGKVRDRARRILCISNLHSIQIAGILYANDNNEFFPHRGDNFDGRPHRMAGTTMPKTMDEIFFTPYFDDKRDEIMFCPGALKKFRRAGEDYAGQPSNSYSYTYVTYQYFNFPLNSLSWLVEQPDIRKTTTAHPKTAMWACLTAGVDLEKAFLSHEMAYKEAHTPSGINAVRVSGDARWNKWNECEVFMQYQEFFFWPNK